MAHADAKTPWWAKDTTPGYLLLGATILSFVLLNSAAAPAFGGLLKAHFGVNLGVWSYETTTAKFVKDALMAVFFLYVGLELKRECVEGPFRSPREAAIPALGAIGGMAAPALIFLAIAAGPMHPDASSAYAHGWAIPTATDIAFAVGVLSLLGARTPPGLRLFLLALAIADDLGAILVIAIFYSSNIALGPLALSAGLVLAMLALGRMRVFALAPYWILGLVLWAVMTKTGVSPTLAGVLTAVAVPMRRPDGRSPLVAAEHALKPWVQLGVMPVFALAVAGVSLAGVTTRDLFHPVAIGIAAGLVLGKPLGILAMTYLGAALLKRPTPGPFFEMLGVTMIAGIGFTMSLFVGALAYADPHLQAPVRFGVLGGSAISAVLGLAVLAWATSRRDRDIAAYDLADEEDVAEARDVFEKR